MLTHFGADAAIYAGGTELLVVMKERLTHSPHLIDIKRIHGLAEITHDAERRELRIGATARHRDIEHSPAVRERIPVLAALEAVVANVRVRAAGTIGGNLCFADPHSDPATLLSALCARLTLTSAAETREVPIDSFITGLMETDRRHDEILTSIVASEPAAQTGVAYERFKLHERPTAAVAAVITVENGTIAAARIVAGSVGDRPQRLSQTERALRGQPATAASAAAAATVLREDVETGDDPFESEQYKRQLVHALGRRAIIAAIGRASDVEGGCYAA